MQITHTLTDNSVTVLGEDFVPKTMPSSHPAFDEVVSALKANDAPAVYRLMDLPAAIANFMQGEISIVDRTLYFKGKPLDTSCTRRIVQFMEMGDTALAKPLVNFLEKVMENPSFRAVQGLYDWAEKSGLPITPEGDIIAWKIVKENYLDIYSESFDNSVGKVVEVPRWEVDEDPDRTCSHGLHVCSTNYLPHYGTAPGSRVMVVRVHPKDFVAVPKDYNCAKARVCRYEVIGEMPREKAKAYLRNSYVFEPTFNPTPRYGELDLDVEVGRYYRTRDGQIAYIDEYDDSSSDYPYVGYIVGVGDRETWTYEGVYLDCTDEEALDLVEEMPIDFVPDEEDETPQPKRGFLHRLFFGD